MFSSHSRYWVLFVCWAWLMQLGIAVAEKATNHHHHHARDPEADAKERFLQLVSRYETETMKTLGPGCTADNIEVRHEWESLTTSEKDAFIAALKCLHSKPTHTPKNIAPGARTRWDDFVVAHTLNQNFNHASPGLSVWHRWFIQSAHGTMRDECGYQGVFPYWDFSKHATQPFDQTPIFDGSNHSMGGDGKPGFPKQGCECITTGPFANFTVNLGPNPVNVQCSQNPQPDGLGYNPRCIERRFSPSDLSHLQYQYVVDQILNNNDADSFGVALEAWGTGLHSAAHEAIGGSIMDTSSSPNDPMLYMLHTMLDFICAIWQSIDHDKKIKELPKASSYDKIREKTGGGPAPSVDLDTELNMYPVGKNIRVREVMSTTAGALCYRYAWTR